MSSIVVAGCSSQLTKISGNGREYVLSDTEIANYTAKAVAGDADAAIRLSSYYGLIELDLVSQRRWMEVAAETGNVEAQYSAGVLYETVDVEKSRYWLQRAASSGDLDAKTKLAQLNTQ